MDATHLAEFHQVEGVVADRNLTLADLIGAWQAVSSALDPAYCRLRLSYLPSAFLCPSLRLFANRHPLVQASCGHSSRRWE